MSNMGYCRFSNTLSDLEDCYEHMEDKEELSEAEYHARYKLIEMCRNIAHDYEDELEE